MDDEKAQRAAPFCSDPSDPVPKGVRPPGRPSYKRKKASQKGLPFYKGTEKEQQLNHLADMYSHHERGFTESQRSMLEHAKAMGEILIEAKRISGGRKKCSEWKHRHGIKPKDKRSLSDYRRVARHWDDPKMVELRESGNSPKSIREFIAVLKGIVGDEETGKPKLYNNEMEVEGVKYEIRRRFGEYVKQLPREQLMTLYHDLIWHDEQESLADYVRYFGHFPEQAGDGSCLKVFDDELRRMVRTVADPPWTEEDERAFEWDLHQARCGDPPAEWELEPPILESV